MEPALKIRKATPKDARGLLQVLSGIVAEGDFTAITEPWPETAQKQYLQALSVREAVHVAEDESGKVIGYQTLDLWARTLASMSHVGQIGTFLAPASRRRGIGRALFSATREFARQHGYRKFVVQVRASNATALQFYSQVGFKQCGRLTRQVRVGAREEDEILMEFFLS